MKRFFLYLVAVGFNKKIYFLDVSMTSFNMSLLDWDRDGNMIDGIFSAATNKSFFQDKLPMHICEHLALGDKSVVGTPSGDEDDE